VVVIITIQYPLQEANQVEMVITAMLCFVQHGSCGRQAWPAAKFIIQTQFITKPEIKKTEVVRTGTAMAWQRAKPILLTINTMFCNTPDSSNPCHINPLKISDKPMKV
jgi:hypothetical protein